MVKLAIGVTALAVALVHAPSASAFGYLSEWGAPFAEGIDVAPDGTVYVGNYDDDQVNRFTSTGVFVNGLGSFGSDGDGVGDLAVNPANGDVYLTDNSGHRVKQVTSTGALIRTWGANGGDGTAGTGPGEFDLPLGIAVGNSSIYVTEAGNHRIQQFGLDGTFIRQWGSNGTNSNEFENPNDIAVAASGDLYVVDNSDRVQQFTSSGGFIREWGSNGDGSGEFEDPLGVAVDPDGDVWVMDDAKLQEFSSSGTFIRKFGKNGGDGTMGSGPGEFTFPFNLAFDCRGNLYIADYGNNRVQKFGEPGAGEPPCPVLPPPAPPQAIVDTILPIQRLLFDKTQHLDSLSVFVQVSEDSNLVGTGTLNLPKGVAKAIRFKRVRRAARANVGVQLRFRLSRKRNRAALRALRTRKRLKAKLRIEATDSAGNKGTRTFRVKVKR